ncbi:MAG: hypothetical protein H0T14_02580, partial [Nocardioidaceae bacterium]|nr:hypothetical protein [Nocardioidaceae bacterium]
MTARGLRLQEQPDRKGLVDALADQLSGRVGIDGVLGDLNRQATQVRPPARAADYAFGWNASDSLNTQWWPQGITTSADSSDSNDMAGRRVLMVGWYAKKVKGYTQGARLSVVDISDLARPSYRHVLLVDPQANPHTAAVTMAPVPVHAGGIIWYGPSVLVADTQGGVRVFDVDDCIRVDGDGHYGYRYVLPQRTSYRAVNDDGFEPFKFSFVSLDRTASEHQLIAGEYGKDGSTTRLVRFAFEQGKPRLAMRAGYSPPLELIDDKLEHMQGATTVNGTFYISTSRGSLRPGSMWVRRPGEPLKEFRGVLARGPEDLSYWPQ